MQVPPDWPERAAARRKEVFQPKPAEVFKPSEVWTRSGVFTRSLSSFYGEKREAADRAGYDAVAVHVDGDLAPANMEELYKLRGEFARLGWKVVGWAVYGYGPEDPVAEGYRHASIVDRHGLDGFMPNGESWAEFDQKFKSALWMQGWKRYWQEKGQPLPPVMVSCLSSTTGLFPREFDYKPFLDYPGAMISPQVYSASHAAYTYSAMLQSMQAAGVSKSRLIPTWDVIEAQPMPDYPKVLPRWLYTGDDCRPSRFAQT